MATCSLFEPSFQVRDGLMLAYGQEEVSTVVETPVYGLLMLW